MSEREAERRAWATVNKDYGGGKKTGGRGRGQHTGHPAAHKGGEEGGKASASRSAADRSASAKKAAATRKRNAEKHARWKLLSESDGVRTFVVVLDPGDAAFRSISEFAAAESVSAAAVTAIGAFESATVGWFDFSSKTYRKIPIVEQGEVLGAVRTRHDPSRHVVPVTIKSRMEA